MQSDASGVTPTDHEEIFSALRDEIRDLESRSRRSNVVFIGFHDKETSEAWDTTERLVKDFFSSKVGVTVDSVARVHRPRRFAQDKRPTIANFFNDWGI